MLTQGKTIKKVTQSGAKRHLDQLVVEKETQIFLNDTLVTTVRHTSQLEKEMGVGCLFAFNKIGFVVDSVSYANHEVRVDATETVVEPVKYDDFMKPIATSIFQLTAYFQEAAILYKKTAVTESAAIGDDKQLLFAAEDMNQKNALYKELGAYILEHKTDLKGKSLLLSSCVTLDLMSIIVCCGFSLIITRTAPTNQALDMAQAHGVSIVGFARGRKFNWYY